MRREWIEMVCVETYACFLAESPSMRREWIEITGFQPPVVAAVVSLHAEGVD